MEPPLSSSSIFFLLLLFLISVNIPTSLGADDVRFANCRSTSFSCGSISNLKYPFTGGNRAQYCGPPDFVLTCEDNIPKIDIQFIKYRILNLDWNSEALTVARDDYYDTICPTGYYQNSTLDPTTFYYDSGAFLYNCSDTTSFQSNVFGQDCRRDDGIYTKVYYVLGSVYLDSCTSVVMPVSLAGDAIAVIPNHIQAALDDGFELRWIVNNNECDTCSNSGGECGYNTTEGQFSCFCKEGPRSTYCLESKKLGWRLKIAIGVSASVAGVAVIFILIFCNWKMRFRNEKWNILEGTGVYYHHNLKTFMKDNGSLAPRQYSFSEVKKMTKSFSNKLGEGGYGVVYKARLPDGRPVAVKVIRDSIGSGEEFINEVVSISRTSHVNIVTLLGFCFERNKRVLIYEYMPNGSLDNFIHKIESPNAFSTLTPKGLYQITIGIARGLEYLHRGCNTRILHFDIKPQNILLDENFCPKISDFGLAKICQKRESIVSIFGARGTIGFIAPEVFSRAYGGVSHKSDVYSYGMLILEMIGGRKNYNRGGSHTSEMYFPDWIYKDLEQGNTSSSSLSISEEENEVMRKITLVSLWCIQINPSDRPAMSNVVEMLEGPLQSLPFPPKPYLHSPLPRSPLLFSNASSDDMLETNSTSTENNASIV